MRLNTRSIAWEMDNEPYDHFHGLFEDDLDLEEMSDDVRSCFWDGDIGNRERFSIKRKIYHRSDMKDLCSGFDALDTQDDRKK